MTTISELVTQAEFVVLGVMVWTIILEIIRTYITLSLICLLIYTCAYLPGYFINLVFTYLEKILYASVAKKLFITLSDIDRDLETYPEILLFRKLRVSMQKCFNFATRGFALLLIFLLNGIVISALIWAFSEGFAVAGTGYNFYDLFQSLVLNTPWIFIVFAIIVILYSLITAGYIIFETLRYIKLQTEERFEKIQITEAILGAIS